MPYIPPEVVAKAKEMDLLTYLKNYEPNELVHFGGSTYCTRTHDSLKISNGKWNWFSRGIGGRSALDYLIKVEGMNFIEAVEHITNCIGDRVIIHDSISNKPKEKLLILPKTSHNNDNVIRYLENRGIDKDVINYCIETGRIYESYPNHNVVMLGFDKYGTPRYANLRGIGTDFKGEASGSDKRFSFSISADNSGTIHLFESAIDLLSYATMLKISEQKWGKDHLVSLAGVYRPGKVLKESSLPLALNRYLIEHPNISVIRLHLDNDRAGQYAAASLMKMLSDKYDVHNCPPPYGKDCNEYLCSKLGIPITKTKSYER